MTRAEREAAEESERLAEKQAKREAKAAARRQHAADLVTYRERLRASDGAQLVRQFQRERPPAEHWASALTSDAATQALLEREAELLAEELAGPKPSAAVKLLAERCALDTLALRHWDRRSASAGMVSWGLDVPEQNLRIADKLHRRLVRSTQALERVRAVQAAARAFDARAPSPTPRHAPVLVLEDPAPALVH